MADEARLTIVIEEPTITTAPGASGGGGGTGGDFPDWYPRFRELRNRADSGSSLSPAEQGELSDLGRKLSEFAGQPVAAAPVLAPPPTLPVAASKSELEQYRNQLTAGLPPVGKDDVRFYHGDAPNEEGGSGGRFVSPHPEYAQGYADKSDAGTLQYVDIPRVHPVLADKAENGAYRSFEVPQELAQTLRPVSPAQGAVPFVAGGRPAASAPAPPVAAGANDQASPAGAPPNAGSAAASAGPPTAAQDMRPNALLDDVFGVPPRESPPAPPAGPAEPAGRTYTVRSMGMDGQDYTDTVTAESEEAAKVEVIGRGRFVTSVKEQHITRNPDQAYRSSAVKAERFGSSTAFADSANKGMREDRAVRQAARHQQNAKVFQDTVGMMPRAHKAAFGGVVGGVKAARAGTSVSAGAAAGAMEAAGGPVGLAIAAAELKDKTVQAAVDGIEGLGKTAQKVAGNDGLGLFKDTADKAVKGLEAIPVVGEQFAVPLKIASTAVVAFADTANAFVARGKELAAYSGELASASASRDVAQMESDFREAERIGPDLARLTKGITDLESLVREALLPIKDFIINILAGVVTNLDDAIRVVLQFLKDSDWVPAAVSAYAKRLLDAIDGNKPTDDLLQEWMNAANALRPGPRPSPLPGGPAAGLGQLPIFTR